MELDLEDRFPDRPVCMVYVCPGCEQMSTSKSDLRTRCTCEAK